MEQVTREEFRLSLTNLTAADRFDDRQQADPGKERAERLARLGVPERYIELEIDPAAIPEAARQWRTRQGNLLIYGRETGTGKTTTAAFLCKLIAETVTSFRFVGVPDLIIRARATWNAKRGGETEDEIVDKLVRPGVLILDDLGAEQSSETSLQLLYAVIDGRWSQNRRTVVTTNLEPADLVARYGDKITSRIFSGVQVQYSGNDRRIFTA